MGWYSWTRLWSLWLILTCLCSVMRHTRMREQQTGIWAGHGRVADVFKGSALRQEILHPPYHHSQWHDIIEGSITSERFHEFLCKLVVHICFPLCVYTNEVKSRYHWLTSTQAHIVFWFLTTVESTTLKRSSSLSKMKPVCYLFLSMLYMYVHVVL